MATRLDSFQYSPVNNLPPQKKHYEDTGYPLVVKLGTIENGDGDIYSYLEDAPVRDHKLREHLAHFGLDIGRFTKTQKTTLEMELDMNMKSVRG
jgi:ubiquitin carboxyl-terminal hydrolase 5/13